MRTRHTEQHTATNGDGQALRTAVLSPYADSQLWCQHLYFQINPKQRQNNQPVLTGSSICTIPLCVLSESRVPCKLNNSNYLQNGPKPKVYIYLITMYMTTFFIKQNKKYCQYMLISRTQMRK